MTGKILWAEVDTPGTLLSPITQPTMPIKPLKDIDLCIVYLYILVYKYTCVSHCHSALAACC